MQEKYIKLALVFSAGKIKRCTMEISENILFLNKNNREEEICKLLHETCVKAGMTWKRMDETDPRIQRYHGIILISCKVIDGNKESLELEKEMVPAWLDKSMHIAIDTAVFLLFIGGIYLLGHFFYWIYTLIS